MPGFTSRNSPMRFASITAFKLLTPVILPPGLLRLVTNPPTTGSPMKADRYQHGGLLVQKIGGLTGQHLIVTFCPSTMPCSAKPLRKASTRCALSLADRALRNAITGLFVGCAFAANGQTAEPAMTLMKSRRLIAPPEFRARQSTNTHGPSGRGVPCRFGSKADMCSALGDVYFVPKADIPPGSNNLR